MIPAVREASAQRPAGGARQHAGEDAVPVGPQDGDPPPAEAGGPLDEDRPRPPRRRAAPYADRAAALERDEGEAKCPQRELRRAESVLSTRREVQARLG